MRPHVSIAWTNGNATPFLAGHAALASLRAASSLPNADAECAEALPPPPAGDSSAGLAATNAIASVSVDSVCVRIGQRTHSIELRAS